MSAIIGNGSRLSVDDGVANAQQDFLFVKEVSVPKADLAYIDASYLNQGDNYRRYIASLIEPGDASFILQYDKADLARCYALRGVTHNWEIEFPEGSLVEFVGILQNAEMTVTVDGIMEISCSVRATGSITFTPS